MKKVIAFLLTLSTLLILALPVMAATPITGTCGPSATWVLDGDTLTISGTGQVNQQEDWRNYQEQIKKLILEEGITSTDSRAFIYLTHVEEVSLPDSLTVLGQQTFQSCDKLVTITLPKNLSKFQLSSSRSAAATVFSGDSLTAIEVHPDNQWFCDVDGVLFDKDMKTLLCYPMGKTDSAYTVPEGVEKLANGSFWYAKCAVNLPNSLKVIDYRAFYAADFTHIEIPNRVNKIEESAFANCDSLIEISLPASVETVGREAFASCDKLKTITFKNPNCNIQNGPDTLTSGVTVKGYQDSTAEAYAKRYGRDFVDLRTGTKYPYNVGNPGYLALLPTNITGTVPVFNRVSAYSSSGELTGYQPDLVLETDPSNVQYQEMLRFVNNLTKDCTSNYEKAKAISSWVNRNMTYRYGLIGTGQTPAGVYNIFKNLEGNCEGHTQLTNFMLHLAGIPNATATSYGHCWSLALLDGRWVMIDSTNNLFDKPDTYYDDILKIDFSPDNKTICVIDDLSGVKLASYGLSISDVTSFTDITIPDFVTYIYSSAFSYCKSDNILNTTIRGTAGGYAHNYVAENLPNYQITVNGDQFVAIAHDHDIQYHAEKPATCTAPGTKAHYSCQGCGKLFSNASGRTEVTAQSLIIPAKGHKYGAYQKNSQHHWKSCSCSNTTEREAHIYGEWVETVSATEHRNGSHYRICNQCSFKETQAIPKLAHTHTMQTIPATAATHTLPGNIAYYACTGCGNIYLESNGTTQISLADTVIPALGHSYGAYQMDAEHHWKTCSCGMTSEPTEHSYGPWAESSTHLTSSCSICGHTISKLAPSTENPEETDSLPSDDPSISDVPDEEASDPSIPEEEPSSPSAYPEKQPSAESSEAVATESARWSIHWSIWLVLSIVILSVGAIVLKKKA